METKFCYSPLKILWTLKESAKILIIRIWFYAFLYFYIFRNLFIIFSEKKSSWNLYWNADVQLCIQSNVLQWLFWLLYFLLKTIPFPFPFQYPTQSSSSLHNFRWLLKNDLILCIVNASSSSSEIPWITMFCNGVIFQVISHVRCLLSRLLLMSKMSVFFLQSMFSLQ